MNHNASQDEIVKNKNADIKFSVHGTFLEYPSSGTLKIERFESQIIYTFGNNKTKGPKQDNQNRLNLGRKLLHLCMGASFMRG